MAQTAEVERLKNLLANASHVGILTHVNPDGDAIGSLLGLFWALREAGHQVSIACVDPVPESYSFLPGVQELTDRFPESVDLAISVDAASLDRTSKNDSVISSVFHVNIDHHISNTNFADLDIISPQASAAAEILTELIPAIGLDISIQVAECLLTGIVSDTIGFSTSSTSTRTLRAAQILMEAGADLTAIYKKSLNQRSFEAIQLWGESFGVLQREDGLIWTRLSLEAKKRAGYAGLGDADVTNLLRTVRDIEVAVILIERPNGDIKISWRSMDGLDVSTIATSFGGGGHAAAAGTTIENSTLAAAEDLVLARTRLALQEHRKNRSA